MLVIKPIQTKEEQKEVCEACGVAFDPDCLAYGARETEGENENVTLLGVSQFRILGDCGVIYDLANAAGTHDLEALIIMGKATLNFIDLCGVKNAMIKTENRNLPEILGFKKDIDGVYKIDLKGYFESPCQQS